MDLTALRYAVTLAEELHFRRAAQRHFISAQPFGQRVKQLEHQLGYAIFARTSRRVSVTPRGELFLVRARDALDRLNWLAQEAPDPGEHTLVLGVFGCGLAELWAPVRAALRAQCPGIRLVHRDLDFLNQYPMVQSGEVDAAIVFYAGPADGLVVDIVKEAPRKVLVPAWSELAEAAFLTTSDLEGREWVPMVAHSDALVDWLGPAAAGHPRSAWAVRPESIPATVATTGALAVLCATAERFFPRPDVRYVSAEGAACHVGIATRAGDTRPAVRAFRRVVAATAGLVQELTLTDRNETA
ncbi:MULTISPECIES: LysR family transcriptional regulator [Catenuloplanes]|uniref:DNA-binding transcriptional LysR family regulator n=1 Tax=Catenuloplanes niger TaxID=587534 RepID=A0AAE4CR39_9ACTN|nr:LysR family transcriptional regulator [Catenuloplanes niger]MDR7322406.1 DNA-binding transcriptional LysR family regulator [Catenuloplanes niger]